HLAQHATDQPAHAAADALRVAPLGPRPEPRGSSPIGPILFGSAGIDGREGVASGATGAPDRPEMGGPVGVAFGSTMEATDGALPTDGPVGGAARQEGPLDAARSTSVAGESQSCIACHDLLPDHHDLRF